jgi:hypothetical protein
VGSDDLFQHMPARDKLGRIFELLVFEDSKDFGECRTDSLSGDLRSLAR